MTGRARAVSLANGVVAAALVAALAAIALVVKPPSPPGIAEFAPKAAKPITKAPPDQAAAHGIGEGACAVGQACATPAPALTQLAPQVRTLDPARAAPPGLQCYEWPDGTVTQTEDPQSPPCIATWDYAKGNGGATARGVTGSTVTVLVPTLDGQIPRLGATIRDLETYFNNRFQFYGRKLHFVAPVGGTHGCDPSTSRAAAGSAAAQRVFASTDQLSCMGNDSFSSALAERHIVSVVHASSQITSHELAGLSPYLWSYAQPFDELQSNAAEFACKNLTGQAEYGGAAVQRKKRSFAVLRAGDGGFDLELLRTRLRSCLGSTPRLVEYDQTECRESTQPKPGFQAQMLQLDRDGVTTLITAGATYDCPQQAADAVGYQPEWFVVPTDIDYLRETALAPGAGHPTNQMGHTFGLLHLDKLLAPNQEPALRAVASVDPKHVPADPLVLRSIYEQLLTLVSGIQQAGPHLTPQTIADGLQNTEFPNPGAATGPSYQAHVGFGPGDHSMVDDIGVWWWSTSAKTAGGSAGGGFCYAERGKRWAAGHWPSTIRLQQGPCR